MLGRRREYAILRVDRADLSKNVLRGFTAFDIFLEQHPEFAERITFTAQLMPSRTDVAEYAEYLEKIEALVAVVNHRHGTPDWMPIDLKLRDDLDEAVASYKHYDVMMVNAMFDGMNLVAKEGPLVNERDGVSILSENTGAHEELGEFAISVNPFDVQELADSIYAALTMAPEARERRRRGAEGDRHLPRSGRLDRRADRGHPREELPVAHPVLAAFRRPASRRSAASIPRPAMPKSGRSASATASAATSIRARGKYWFTENARDWISDDMPSDKLNMISKIGEHFGYPYCHQGDMPDPKFAMGHKCSEFTPPVLNLGAHVAPLGMKFYTGDQFPAEYKNNILIAEHGSWNRHKYQGARIMRVIVDADGKNAKQEMFASGWLEGDQGYLGRPADIILAKDGSILVADDWAGAIYRISYSKK